MMASHAKVTTRRKRTDARRNRAAIVDVAERMFAERGVDVSMDSIAKSAGVGAGTLYRHFPSREFLIAAVLEAHGPNLAEEAKAIELAGVEPDDALGRWVAALGEWMRAYDGLPEPVRAALSDGDSPLLATCQQLVDITERFLQAAQRSGSARPDVRARDLYVGALGAAWATVAPSADHASREGCVQLLREGWASRPTR